MKNNRNKDYEWTLTVVRDGRQGLVKNATDCPNEWRSNEDITNLNKYIYIFILIE